MTEGYARVTIYVMGEKEDTPEYTATVRMVRPNGQTGGGWPLGRLYEGYTGMTFRVGEDDQTLEVALTGEEPIVIYVDYFHTDGRPWFQPPKNSQDTFTLQKNPTPQGGGQMHIFSVKQFLEL